MKQAKKRGKKQAMPGSPCTRAETALEATGEPYPPPNTLEPPQGLRAPFPGSLQGVLPRRYPTPATNTPSSGRTRGATGEDLRGTRGPPVRMCSGSAQMCSGANPGVRGLNPCSTRGSSRASPRFQPELAPANNPDVPQVAPKWLPSGSEGTRPPMGLAGAKWVNMCAVQRGYGGESVGATRGAPWSYPVGNI